MCSCLLIFLALLAYKTNPSEIDGNFTTITISRRTVTITAAAGYTPIIESGKEKPIIILERNDSETTTTVFETITVVDDLDAKSYPMPRDCDGKDDVFVGRIRRDISGGNGIAFWCVSDNLRKGAATNAVQIAELLVKRSAAAAK